MQYEFIPRGVCSRRILVELEDNIIRSVRFEGGCNGNLQGISRLVVGLDVDEAISKLAGIRCGMKMTSCPDQLSQALRQAKAER